MPWSNDLIVGIAQRAKQRVGYEEEQARKQRGQSNRWWQAEEMF